jgi:hypothetical protein
MHPVVQHVVGSEHRRGHDCRSKRKTSEGEERRLTERGKRGAGEVTAARLASIYLTLTKGGEDGEGGREECEGERVAMRAAYIDQRDACVARIPGLDFILFIFILSLAWSGVRGYFVRRSSWPRPAPLDAGTGGCACRVARVRRVGGGCTAHHR